MQTTDNNVPQKQLFITENDVSKSIKLSHGTLEGCHNTLNESTR